MEVGRATSTSGFQADRRAERVAPSVRMDASTTALRRVWLASSMLGVTLAIAAWFGPAPAVTHTPPEALPRAFGACGLLLAVGGVLLPKRSLESSMRGLEQRRQARRPPWTRGLERYRKRVGPSSTSSGSAERRHDPRGAHDLDLAQRNAMLLGTCCALGILVLSLTLSRLGGPRTFLGPLVLLGTSILGLQYPGEARAREASALGSTGRR